MKARSRKFLGAAAVIVAAGAAYTVPTAHAAGPGILYEVVPTGAATVDATAGGSLGFNVLALVTDGSTGTGVIANTGLVQGQFSLVQTPGGITNSTVTFTLNGTYSPSGSSATNTAVFGNVPNPSGTNGTTGTSLAGGSLGAGAASTGSNNDTIIGITGVSGGTVSSSAPAPNGSPASQVVNGVNYNTFLLGSGTVNIPGGQATGSTVSLSIAPRGGLGNLIKPQVAIIGGTLDAFRGDDAAVTESAPVSFSAASGHVPYPGDTNDDNFVDFTDFTTLVNNYQTHTTLGYKAGDFDNSGLVDFTDFTTLVNHYLTGPGTGAGDLTPLAVRLAAVPEPTSLAALAIVPMLAMRRRRKA